MFISDETLAQLHDATMSLLERVGVCLDSDEALALCADHGIRVDFHSRRVFPSAHHVETALSTVPRSATIYGWGNHPPVVLAPDHVSIQSGGGNLRVLTLEGTYESSSWEHLRRFNRLLDALPNIHICINQVDPVDDARDGFYRRLAAEMFLGCSKPICFQAGEPSDVHAMLEMGAVIRGSSQALRERPVFMLGLNSEPPLHISGPVVQALLSASRAMLPTSMGCYAMMGITSPVTVAGSCVHINAVQLVSFVVSQLVHPGAPLCYTSFAGSSDMRTLEMVSSNPHATQLLRASAAMGRYYGLPVYGVAVTDAKQVDSQAACERALQLQISIDAGANLIQGPTAHMDQFMLTSYTQAVIDNDIAGYVLAANRPLEVTADTLALDATDEVIADPTLADLKFSAHAHTAAHLREALWQPKAFYYGAFSRWQRAGGTTVLERATAIAREILEDHQPETLPKEVVAEIRRIEATSG